MADDVLDSESRKETLVVFLAWLLLYMGELGNITIRILNSCTHLNYSNTMPVRNYEIESAVIDMQ